MAETKKRNTNQKNNSKKSGNSNRRSSNRNDSSNASGPDLLTIVVVIIAVILVGALIMNYKKEREGEKEAGTTPAATATQPPKEETPGLTEEPDPTKKLTPEPAKELTPGPTKEPEATKEPDPTDAPVPTEEVFLPRKEAEALLTAWLDTSLYQTELLSDHLPIDGKTYYLFCINDKNGKTYEPLVIVEKKEGAIFYYDAASGTISDFLKFPLDATEPQGTGDKAITKEEAVEILKGFSAEQLGLAMELTKYQLEPDDWSTTVPTTVGPKECYGINVFEAKDGKKLFHGTFYVANDGKNVYKPDPEVDENGFVEIKK